MYIVIDIHVSQTTRNEMIVVINSFGYGVPRMAAALTTGTLKCQLFHYIRLRCMETRLFELQHKLYHQVSNIVTNDALHRQAPS